MPHKRGLAPYGARPLRPEAIRELVPARRMPVRAGERSGMKEYRVVTSQDTVFWGGALSADDFAERLNAAAVDGWELVTTTTVESQGFLGERHQLFFVFARETAA